MCFIRMALVTEPLHNTQGSLKVLRRPTDRRLGRKELVCVSVVGRQIILRCSLQLTQIVRVQSVNYPSCL